MIAMEIPEGWVVTPQSRVSWEVKTGDGRLVFVGIMLLEFNGHDFDWMKQESSLKHRGRRKGLVVDLVDPFRVGRRTGLQTRYYSEQSGSQIKTALIESDHAIWVGAFDLGSQDEALLWQAIGTLEISAKVIGALKSGHVDLEPPAWDVRSLANVKRKKLTTWMDHQMMLVCDAATEWEPADDLESNPPSIWVMSPEALFVLSVTEFDVAIEVAVRPTPLKRRVGAWQCEQRARVSVPSGQLNLEATAGGTILAMKLTPGDYEMLARWQYPEGADGGTEGVERIMLDFWLST